MNINILISVFLILGIIVLIVVAIFAIKTYKVYKNKLESMDYEQEPFISINYLDINVLFSLDSLICIDRYEVTPFDDEIKKYGIGIQFLGNVTQNLTFNTIEERDNIYNFIISRLYYNNVHFEEYDEHIIYL